MDPLETTPAPTAAPDGVVDQAAVTPPVDPAPIADQPTTDNQDSLELPFKIEDIAEDFTLTGEEARRWLQTRQAQMQAGLTRKTQELATQRSQLETWAERQARLESDDTEAKRQALNELLEPHGLQLPEDWVPGDPTEGEPIADGEVDDPVVADLQRRLAAAEAREAQRAQTAEQAERERVFDEHVSTSMDKIAEKLGLESVEKLDAEDQREIVGRALLAPRLANGLPDFDAGFASFLANQERIAAAERAKVLAAKDVPPVTGGGGSGVPAPQPLKSASDRLKRAAAVAGRHYDG